MSLPIPFNPNLPSVSQAKNDDQLIELWLHGRSPHTQRAYRSDVNQMLEYIGKPFAEITLSELQSFSDTLEELGLAPASQRRIMSSIKSLFGFACRLGYLTFDVARPIRLKATKNQLAQRILEEGEVQKMIALEINPRNHTLLLLLYASGVRVSEVCGLKWEDIQERESGCQINVFGKGSKTRTILLPQKVWDALQSLHGDHEDKSPVFLSRHRKAMHPSTVLRIVRLASQRASIKKSVSPHWLRHANASHSLDRACPISVVQATLGHSSLATCGNYLHARPTDSTANYLGL